jgi:hypothetical protein
MGNLAHGFMDSWAHLTHGLFGTWAALWHMGTRVIGHLDSCALWHSGSWDHGLKGSWLLGHLGSRALGSGLIVSWAHWQSGFLGSWALGRLFRDLGPFLFPHAPKCLPWLTICGLLINIYFSVMDETLLVLWPRNMPPGSKKTPIKI